MKNNSSFKNLLICGDNLEALDDLIKKGIQVDLIYLDPPFFSNRHYEVVWGDEAEVRSFKDRWAGGINVYIGWMRERVVKMYDVLKDTGSFYLHCDWHASHYLKVMLDEIFGYHNFRNEIAWRRTPFSGSSKSRSQQLPRSHDSILFYVKGDKWIWNAPTKPYSDEYLKRFKWKDNRGFYRKTLLKTYSQETLEKLKEENRLIEPVRLGAKYSYKQYLSESKRECLIDDIWTDINMINPVAKERLGYPTQKPEVLLERIIKASSDKEKLVLDPFCGCGTAMGVAHQLKRKWIGIDISPTAIGLIEKRLEKLGAIKGKDYDSTGMPTTLSELKSLEPFEFQNWIINEMKAKQSKRLVSDMGIDGYYDKTIFTERAGIQVKQSEKVGRNVVDNFETALRRGKYEKGFIVAFSFTRGAHEEVARVKGKGLDIKLISVEDFFYGKVKI